MATKTAKKKATTVKKAPVAKKSSGKVFFMRDIQRVIERLANINSFIFCLQSRL